MATLAFMLRDAAISVDSLDKSKTYTNYYPVSFWNNTVQIDSMDKYEIEYDENIDKWVAASEAMGGGYAITYAITNEDYERILNIVCYYKLNSITTTTSRILELEKQNLQLEKDKALLINALKEIRDAIN